MSNLNDTVGYVVMEQSPNTGIWYEAVPGESFFREKAAAVAQLEEYQGVGTKFPLAVAELNLIMITTYKDGT